MSNEVKNHSEEIILSPLKDARACYRRYKHQLTKEEQEWYENFLAGVYRGDEDALKKICPDVKKRREISQERTVQSNAARRHKPNGAQRKTGYSPNDYIPAETNPEAALVDALDDREKRRSR